MWDFPIILGILGVVLTVVFFWVGYRQTIGARKERANAANRQILDALFRRLVLDDSFPLDRSGVGKVLLGTALSASVRTDDIYSPTELEAVLYARSMESDYMDDAKRVDVMSRLAKCFAEMDETAPQAVKKTRAGIPLDVWLAFGSALTAMVATLATVPFLEGVSLKPETISEPVIGIMVAGLGALIGMTAVVLTTFTRLRDVTRRTSTSSISAGASEIELRLLKAANKINRTFVNSTDVRIDFIFNDGSGLCGVELKADINRIPNRIVSSMIKRMEDAASSLNLHKIYIVSEMEPAASKKDLETDNLKILSSSDFLKQLK